MIPIPALSGRYGSRSNLLSAETFSSPLHFTIACLQYLIKILYNTFRRKSRNIVKNHKTKFFSKKAKKHLHFSWTYGIIILFCGYGGIGRRAWFRFMWWEPCRFKSCYPHHTECSYRTWKVLMTLGFLLPSYCWYGVFLHVPCVPFVEKIFNRSKLVFVLCRVYIVWYCNKPYIVLRQKFLCRFLEINIISSKYWKVFYKYDWYLVVHNRFNHA